VVLLHLSILSLPSSSAVAPCPCERRRSASPPANSGDHLEATPPSSGLPWACASNACAPAASRAPSRLARARPGSTGHG
jgi:hypothetical protein